MADETHTIPVTRIHRLKPDEQVVTGCNFRFRLDYSDYTFTGTGATDTATITLMATPADWGVVRVFQHVVTAWAGPGAWTGSVGTDSDTVSLMAAVDNMTAGPYIGVAGGVPATNDAQVYAPGTDNLTWRGTSATSGGPNAITAGVTDVYIGLIDFNKLGVDTSIAFHTP